jgi:hypothetical protein
MRNVSPRAVRRALLGLLLAFACGKTSAPQQSFEGLVQVSGLSPFPPACGGSGGVVFVNAESEPHVAVNPRAPQNLIAAWQQDRWSNGGARGVVSAASFDSGHTWSRVAPPFTYCAGGGFERATDPWVAFSPDGTAYQIVYAFTPQASDRAMLVSRSTDGGKSWSSPVALQRDIDPDVAVDKETLTADPLDSRFVYAVWDRLTGFSTPSSTSDTGPAWFTRTTDGGLGWEAARVIYDPGPDSQTISNQIAVLPDGTLLDLMQVIDQMSSPRPVVHLAVLRSADRGGSWSPPVTIGGALFSGVVDPKNRVPVRTGSLVPSIGVDPAGGAVYVAWEDARFSGGARDGIALSKSTDGGKTWSGPSQVNQVTGTQAFTPMVKVAADGTVGVSYTDLRDDDPGDASRLLATHWLVVSGDGGGTWRETQLTGPFDLANAPFLRSGGVTEGYFLGDYEGLVQAGGAFLPLVVVARNDDAGNRTDVFFRPADAPAISARKPGLPQASLLGRLRDRWRFRTLFR